MGIWEKSWVFMTTYMGQSVIKPLSVNIKRRKIWQKIIFLMQVCSFGAREI